jgi:hypothetical protein
VPALIRNEEANKNLLYFSDTYMNIVRQQIDKLLNNIPFQQSVPVRPLEGISSVEDESIRFFLKQDPNSGV